MAFAEKTTVPIERTKAEIGRLLEQHQCGQHTIGTDRELRRAMVEFKAKNRLVRFIVEMPNPADPKFTHIDKWRRRAAGAMANMVEQAERQRWRALLLVIKAKFESIESGIATFEQEFLANIVLPKTNTMIGELIIPRIEEAYTSNRLLEAHE